MRSLNVWWWLYYNTLQNRSIELNDTGRALIDYARLPSQRLNDYSLLLSDLIKICNQLGEPTSDLEKGLELVNWIPSKSRDIKFIQSIEGFGDTRVGRILRHVREHCFYFAPFFLFTSTHLPSSHGYAIVSLPGHQPSVPRSHIPAQHTVLLGCFPHHSSINLVLLLLIPWFTKFPKCAPIPLYPLQFAVNMFKKCGNSEEIS